MGVLKSWVTQILKSETISDGVIGNLPLVEILGTKRVLIENHRYIALYEPAEIDIHVAGGLISISGSNLSLAYMSMERIVITGNIESLTFGKEESK